MAVLNYSLELKEGFPQCNPDGTQTWVYIITKTGDTSSEKISHWDLELCPEHEVLRVSKNGVEVSAEDADDIDVTIFYPENENASCLFLPDENVRVIKWNNLNDDEVAPTALGEFNFVLSRCFQEGEIRVSIKGGSEQTDGCDIRTIIGPTCEEEPSRGIDFSNLKDMDIVDD